MKLISTSIFVNNTSAVMLIFLASFRISIAYAVMIILSASIIVLVIAAALLIILTLARINNAYAYMIFVFAFILLHRADAMMSRCHRT
jgi:hypothetical protein